MSEESTTCSVCKQPLAADGHCPHCDEDIHVWTIRDWRPLFTLALVTVLGFSFTSLVVNTFKEKQKALASDYYGAGIRAMNAKQTTEAVDDFETALVYSHDNFEYRLKLTDALVAAGQSGEALGQLHTFWEQKPGDAQINLQLARLEAKRNHLEDASRFYQNSIEGAWPAGTDPVPLRTAVRFEFAEFLVKQGRREQANAALFALASVLATGSPEQNKLAQLFMENGDAAHALNFYQLQLSRNSHDAPAIFGAAKASYATGNYSLARRYLQEIKPETSDSQTLLRQLDRMEALDPFTEKISPRIRTERTMAAFRIAIDRLAGCGVPFAQAMSSGSASQNAQDPTQWSGFARWAQQIQPWMSEKKLHGRDDVIESTMRFAFQAELAAQKACGTPTLDDEALLLLARERMGLSQ